MFKEIIFDQISDKRGHLVAIENCKNIPFEIKRVYYMYGVPDNDIVRGGHAHKILEQVLICPSGSCDIYMESKGVKKTVHLSSPNQGLYMSTLVWHTMTNFSKNCVLMSIASQLFDINDYIGYDEFKKLDKG